MIGALLMRRQAAQAFAAMCRKDVRAMCRGVGDDAVIEFPGKSPVSGRYMGPEGMAERWHQAFEWYETFDIRPKRIALTHPYAFGTTNTALVEWVNDVVARDGSTWHFEGVAVLEVRRGKLVRARDYFFDPSGLDRLWERWKEWKQTSATTGTAQRE